MGVLSSFKWTLSQGIKTRYYYRRFGKHKNRTAKSLILPLLISCSFFYPAYHIFLFDCHLSVSSSIYPVAYPPTFLPISLFVNFTMVNTKDPSQCLAGSVTGQRDIQTAKKDHQLQLGQGPQETERAPRGVLREWEEAGTLPVTSQDTCQHLPVPRSSTPPQRGPCAALILSLHPSFLENCASQECEQPLCSPQYLQPACSHLTRQDEPGFLTPRTPESHPQSLFLPSPSHIRPQPSKLPQDPLTPLLLSVGPQHPLCCPGCSSRLLTWPAPHSQGSPWRTTLHLTPVYDLTLVLQKRTTGRMQGGYLVIYLLIQKVATHARKAWGCKGKQTNPCSHMTYSPAGNTLDQNDMESCTSFHSVPGPSASSPLPIFPQWPLNSGLTTPAPTWPLPLHRSAP